MSSSASTPKAITTPTMNAGWRATRRASMPAIVRRLAEACVGRAMSVIGTPRVGDGVRCGKTCPLRRRGARRASVGAEHQEVGVLEGGLGRNGARRWHAADDVMATGAGAPADERVRAGIVSQPDLSLCCGDEV